MTDKGAIQLVHKCLKRRDRWFIEPYAPEGLEDIAEKAKEAADYGITDLSLLALYSRYKTWKKSEPFMKPNAHLFHEFVNYVCFDLGKASLDEDEKDLFEENCNLTLKFIN